MNDKVFRMIYKDAGEYKDPFMYASDWALSSTFMDPENPAAELSPDVYQELITLWHIANDDFRDFLALIGLNQTQCSNRFCIPLRTIQSWALGERAAPPYVRLMMAELSGIVKMKQ